MQVGAPIPGLITALSWHRHQSDQRRQAAHFGSDEMQTTLYAPCDGTVAEISAK